MSLKIYNSLTKNKDEFIPLNPPSVGMYVCGPTVYGHPHLGHARSYIAFDIIYRYLMYKGFKVRYVQNITDVGHLVGDQDQGEDKIQKQAKTEKLEPVEIAYKYEISYFEDMDMLNILRPNISCRATGHIYDMIDLIKKLIDKKHAYITNEGNIYFDVKSFKDYGKLSKRKLEDALEGERIELADDKKNPEDFALWKKADPAHLMQWDSPWGKGFPGWHLECSAMGMKYIGETLDIHGGGIDNIFPHHECEIAQSEAANGKPFTKFFVHNNILTVDGKKMGKSLGNFIILKDLYKKINPMVLRFYILLVTYRSPLDFTDAAMESAKQGYERLKNSFFSLKKIVENKNITKKENYADVDLLKNQFIESLDDDFNTSKAIAILYEVFKISNTELLNKNPDIDKLIYIYNIVNDFTDKILGLKFNEAQSEDSKLNKLVEYILEMRNKFRKEKNFKYSDEIRDALTSFGINIKDEQDKTSYTI